MGSRQERINEGIQRVLSEAVGSLEDDRIGFVTITRVQVSGDQAHARVGFTVLGDEDERDRTAAALDSAAPALQAAVANGVRMRRTPQLTFVYDGSTDHAMRISELLAAEASPPEARTDVTDDESDT